MSEPTVTTNTAPTSQRQRWQENPDLQLAVFLAIYRRAVLEEDFNRRCNDPATARAAVEEEAGKLNVDLGDIPRESIFLFGYAEGRVRENTWHVFNNFPRYQGGEQNPDNVIRGLACTYSPWRGNAGPESSRPPKRKAKRAVR